MSVDSKVPGSIPGLHFDATSPLIGPMHYGLTWGPVPSQRYSVSEGCISGTMRLKTKQTKNPFKSPKFQGRSRKQFKS